MNKVLLTGGSGLVGRHIFEIISKAKYHVLNISSKDYDLTEKTQVEELFKKFKPDYVIHAAAKVGGLGGHIGKNSNFLYDNSLINLHMINQCIHHNVKKLLCLSSVAAFPYNCTNLKEELMCQGPVHSSEFGYAISKRLMDHYIQACRKEYQSNFCSVIPCNIYGPYDNFNLENGHVIPSLIHKIYLAIKQKTNLKVWGDGLSLREFIYVRDLAGIICTMLEKSILPDRIIVVNPKTYNIKEVVNTLAKITRFEGDIIYSNDNMNGLRVRESDTSKLKELNVGFPSTSLESGLSETWQWFLESYPNVRK